MTNTNHVVIIGNITREMGEKDFGYIGNGNAKATINLAVNRSRKAGDTWENETSYFEVVIFGKTAENLKPYLTKGQKVAIDGRLKQDRWEKDGQKHFKVYIIADSVELCGGKTTTDNPNHIVKKATPAAAETSEGFPEDIPF